MKNSVLAVTAAMLLALAARASALSSLGSARSEALDRNRAAGFLRSFLDREYRRKSVYDQARKRGQKTESLTVTGSGLGLPIALRIVRVHGGDIRYSPRKCGGFVSGC